MTGSRTHESREALELNSPHSIHLSDGADQAFPTALISAVAGLVAVAVGLLVLTGWLFDLAILTSFVPGTVSMQPNAAVCFVLFGTALLLAAWPDPGRALTAAAYALSVVVALIAGATLAQYFSGQDYGIDQLLRVGNTADGSTYPGRMSPQSALSFVMLSIGLLLTPLRIARFVALVFAVGPFALASLNIFDFLFGAEAPTILAAYTQMSLPAAGAFVILSIGIMGRLPGGGPLGVATSRGIAGMLSRRFLIAAVLIPVGVGWLRLEGERRGLYGSAYGVSLTVLAMIFLFTGVIWRSAHNLQRSEASQHAAEAALRKSSERLRQAQIVGASERRFRSLVQNSSDIVMVVDRDAKISYQSQSVERVLGYSMRDRLGRDAFQGIHPEDEPYVRGVFADLIRTPGGDFVAEFRMRHADGSWRVMEATAKNLVDDAAVNGIVINERDVTDRRALEEQLRHQALHDPLTGLANRILFADRVDHALARGPDSSLAVLFLDLDDFKTVNDSLGHIVGDEFLLRTAERLQQAIRTEDTGARLGGDEFGILLEDTDVEAAVEIAQRLLTSMRRPVEVGGRQVSVSASIGIALSDGRGKTAEELLRSADAAMYTAKSQGKGGFELYDASMQVAALRRLELKADLQRALDEGQLSLRYQPIVVLATEEVRGVEALVRWVHPVRGVVLPHEFIPLAEETGQIVPLGQWVLLEACRQVKDWDIAAPSHKPLTMSVNLSARQLEHPEIIEEVRHALKDSGIDPARLTLEITETALVEEGDRSIEIMRELKALGLRLAIDDFGTGYSSLSYLRRFPVDILKIDRSFVATAGSVEEQALLRSIIELSKTLQLETVVEGVEKPEELARLLAVGGSLGQGYLFAKPMEADAIVELLLSNRTRVTSTA